MARHIINWNPKDVETPILSGLDETPCSPSSFERGYFCAVAVFLKENYSEGVAGSDAQSLFRQGGDWRKADPEDIETFRLHDLIPSENAELTHGSPLDGSE